jgi:hypothetical protein
MNTACPVEFAVVDQLHPCVWENETAAHLGNVGLTEFYGGFVYAAVGEQRDVKSIL